MRARTYSVSLCVRELLSVDMSHHPAAPPHHYGSATLSKSEDHGRFHQRSVLGGFNSFEGDSLPDYSEFDTESVTLEYFNERYTRTCGECDFAYCVVPQRLCCAPQQPQRVPPVCSCLLAVVCVCVCVFSTVIHKSVQLYIDGLHRM